MKVPVYESQVNVHSAGPGPSMSYSDPVGSAFVNLGNAAQGAADKVFQVQQRAQDQENRAWVIEQRKIFSDEHRQFWEEQQAREGRAALDLGGNPGVAKTSAQWHGKTIKKMLEAAPNDKAREMLKSVLYSESEANLSLAARHQATQRQAYRKESADADLIGRLHDLELFGWNPDQVKRLVDGRSAFLKEMFPGHNVDADILKDQSTMAATIVSHLIQSENYVAAEGMIKSLDGYLTADDERKLNDLVERGKEDADLKSYYKQALVEGNGDYKKSEDWVRGQGIPFKQQQSLIRELRAAESSESQREENRKKEQFEADNMNLLSLSLSGKLTVESVRNSGLDYKWKEHWINKIAASKDANSPEAKKKRNTAYAELLEKKNSREGITMEDVLSVDGFEHFQPSDVKYFFDAVAEQKKKGGINGINYFEMGQDYYKAKSKENPLLFPETLRGDFVNSLEYLMVKNEWNPGDPEVYEAAKKLLEPYTVEEGVFFDDSEDSYLHHLTKKKPWLTGVEPEGMGAFDKDIMAATQEQVADVNKMLRESGLPATAINKQRALLAQERGVSINLIPYNFPGGGRVTVRIAEKINPQYVRYAERYAPSYGVDPDLIVSMMWVESRGKEKAVSPAGASGLMQFMPGTAKRFGIDPNDPEQAVYGAARYMAFLLDHYNGDKMKAVAAYNWGEGNLDKNGLAKMPKETKAYLKQVFEHYHNVEEGVQGLKIPPIAVDWIRDELVKAGYEPTPERIELEWNVNTELQAQVGALRGEKYAGR